MAKDIFVDVTLEVPFDELRLVSDPARYCWEAMRHKADGLCAESGARLRTDAVPEITFERGSHPLLGGDFFLCASRWPVVAPESVLTR